ncbi:MAG TPA: DUF4214 domain-containing protein, partial [Pyrinomonadaceae bacterium]
RLSTASWLTDEWSWNRGAIVNYNSTADLTCQGQTCRSNSGPDNNGTLRQSQYWIPTNDQMSGYNWTEDRYGYDPLNRLESVAEYHGSNTSGLSGQDFKQAYSYDRYGNRTIDQVQTTTNVPHPNYTADANSNRLLAPIGYSYSYDAAGNQTNDNYTGAGSRTYNGENHLTTAQGYPNNQWQTYTYDATGRRIKRNVNGVETWQVYGMGGELLAEYKAGAAPFLPTKEYGYRSGQLLVTMASGDDARLSRFVTNLYYGALQRDPTSGELQDKVNQLAAAGATSQAQLLTVASQIARALFTGTNYETNAPARTDAQYVGDLYYAYLQRGPDDSGLGWWTGQVAANGRANVCNAFEGSSEFITLVSTLYGTAVSDNERTEHFVNDFYLGARGTNASPTELQTQRDALNAAAAQGLSQVQAQAETFGRSLFTAQVNDAGLSNTQFVTNLYEAFLQRGPDAGGLSFWSGQATVGTGRQNVLSQFATCGSFRELAGTLYREAFWLVSDHIGTPRMIVDKSGTLASVKRHDYLPFGEELSAGMSGRTTTQGYTGDSVRQHFTGYEADGETGLNFAQARYQSNLQGRFTSVDPLGASAIVADPQSFNRYSYVNNNPTNVTDPSGMMTPNPATGIVQTDDESYARTLQGSSDAKFKQDVNKDAAGRMYGAGTVSYVNNRAVFSADTNLPMEYLVGPSEPQIVFDGVQLLDDSLAGFPEGPLNVPRPVNPIRSATRDEFNSNEFTLDVDHPKVDINGILGIRVKYHVINGGDKEEVTVTTTDSENRRWRIAGTPQRTEGGLIFTANVYDAEAKINTIYVTVRTQWTASIWDKGKVNDVRYKSAKAEIRLQIGQKDR